jgi:anaerobic selenocysteine-containing dehydrogenase
MTFGTVDRLMGSKSRNVIFMSPDDAERLLLQEGERVVVRSASGEMNGSVRIAPLRSGTLQAYWPEANVLISRRTDSISGQPDYNVEVSLEKLIG